MPFFTDMLDGVDAFLDSESYPKMEPNLCKVPSEIHVAYDKTDSYLLRAYPKNTKHYNTKKYLLECR
jgi:hypothetical protein